MDRLQHDESHTRVQLEMSHSQLKQTQVCILGLRWPFVMHANIWIKSVGVFGIKQ